MTNPTELRFGTYNIGQGWQDYSNMCLASNTSDKFKEKYPSANESKDKEEQAIFLEQNEVEKDSAEKIAQNFDVICLQEVTNTDRMFIKTLTNSGFQLCHYSPESGGNFSTAVAVRKKSFEKIENHSFKSETAAGKIYGEDIAVAEAELNGKTYRFSSLHSWGFQLYHPDTKEDDRKYWQSDKNQSVKALMYAKEAINVNSKPGADYVSMGADMNNNPENFPQGFDIFTQSNYKVLEPNTATNINRYETDYKERKIDFLFHKQLTVIQMILQKIVSIFKKTSHVELSSPKVLEDFEFKFGQNCSDHKPLRITIKQGVQDSHISRFWKKIRSCFK